MNDEKRIEYLLNIYRQQHYFIDRHDSMAEKFINVLLVEVTGFSIIYTLIYSAAQQKLSVLQTAMIILFILCFIVTLIQLLLIVRPLSKKAKTYNNEDLLNNENKAWIQKSLFYYQGIMNQIEQALSNNTVPCESYLKSIENDNIINDLTQQIFILAQYSNYKRKKLELSLYLILGTSISGVASLMVLLFT